MDRSVFRVVSIHRRRLRRVYWPDVEIFSGAMVISNETTGFWGWSHRSDVVEVGSVEELKFQSVGWIAPIGIRNYNILDDVTFDPVKRDTTLVERGLDFADAPLVFSGVTFEVEDTRKDYGEVRIICFGWLRGRLVVIGYTPRGSARHIFSMRKANEREKARLSPILEN
jgi:uncharacterized DUF497 family protein